MERLHFRAYIMYSLRLISYSVFIVFTSVFTCNANIKTFYFTSLCPFGRTTYTNNITLGSTVWDYNSSAIVKAKAYSTYNSGQTCKVIVKPPIGHGVVAAIRKVDLPYSCISNSLTLKDSYGSETLFCGGINYYSDESRSVYSYGQLTITFQTSQASSVLYDGFQLTVTAYKNWPCSSYEFECSNLKCISKKLTCDGHNHCGDRSDQSRCGVRSVGGTVGVVFGCIFVVVAIVAAVVYSRSRRNRTIVSTTIQSPPPPQPMNPPYGSVYPAVVSYQPPPPPQYYANPPPPPPHQEAVNPLYK